MATEGTTLMMLYTAEQFLENDVPCPAGHPAHSAWAASPKEGVKRGEIGELKTEAQMDKVAEDGAALSI